MLPSQTSTTHARCSPKAILKPMDNRGSHVSPKKLLSTEDAHYHGNPPWSKPRGQRTVGCPTPADTSAVQPLPLRLREH